MEPLEISAKTVDEAVDSALNKLGLNRSEVSIEVLQEGKGGIFGWRVEEAKVRVTPLASVQEPGSGGNGSAAAIGVISDTARKVVEDILSLMDVPADIQVTGGGDDQSPLVIEISNEARDSDLGILIGRRGQSLMALQYVTNFIVSRKLGSNARVTVDVAGYRKRRQEELEGLALRVADLVKSSRKSITLEAMPASERRIIHLTLKSVPQVATESTGFGDSRKVVVSLK